MARGKQTCKILKEIRRQIAEANGIELVTSECRYKGDCLGTCPKCEAEVRFLEHQLRARTLAGRAVSLAGISVSALAMLLPSCTNANSASHGTNSAINTTDTITIPTLSDTCPVDSAPLNIDTLDNQTSQQNALSTIKTFTVGGHVREWDYVKDGIRYFTALIGAKVKNLRTGEEVSTQKKGRYEIQAAVGDKLVFSYTDHYGHEYENQTINITTPTDSLDVLLYEIIVVGEADTIEEVPLLKLQFENQNGEYIDPIDISIERIRKTADGRTESKEVTCNNCKMFDFEILWDKNIPTFDDEKIEDVKQVTLRITSEDHSDVLILDVKRPEGTLQTIHQFKIPKK